MEKFTCRLCLKVAEGGGLYKHVNEDTMKMLNNCFPDVNLSLEHEMLLCSRCIVVLEVSCNFKKCVMQTERKIFSKCHNSSLFKVSMKTLLTDVQLRRYEHEKLNEFNICRLCLQINNYKCNVYLFESPSSKLLYNSVVEAYQHVLELDLSVSEKPVMCDNCWNTLKVVSAFRKRCLNTEQKFRAYCLENNLASLKNSDFYHIAKKYPNNEMQKLVLNNLSFEEFEQIVRKHGIDGLPEEKTIRTNINKNDLINLNNVKVEQNDDLELPNLQYALNNATQNATFKAHRETEEQDLEIEVPCDDQKNKIEVMEPKVLLPPGANLDIVEDNSENEIVDDVEIKCEVDEDSLEESVIKVESVNDKIFRNLIVDLSGSRINNIQVDNKSPSKRKVVLQKLVIDLSSSTMDMDLFTNLKNLGLKTDDKKPFDVYDEKVKVIETEKEPPVNTQEPFDVYDEKVKVFKTENEPPVNTQEPFDVYDEKVTVINTENEPPVNTRGKMKKRVISKEGRHYCPDCPYSSKKRYYVISHMLSHYETGSVPMFKCDQCWFETKRKCALKPHKLTHIPSGGPRPFACTRCKYSTISQTRLTAHMKIHKNSQYTCAICDYTCKLKQTLLLHLRTHQLPGGKPLFCCPHCDFRSPTKANLKKHQLVHGDENFKCKYCKFASKRLDYLERHMKHHLSTTVYKCNQCPYETKIEEYLKKHEEIHGEFTYKCEDCSYRTKRRKFFHEHVKIHAEPGTIPVFRCDKCSYETVYPNYFRDHYTKHNAKTVKCSHCDFKTTRMKYLKRHTLNKHVKREIVYVDCPLCPQKVKSKFNLQKHMLNKHSDELNEPLLECAKCEYKTRNKIKFARHDLKHTSSWKCNVCLRKLSTEKCLQEHMSIHAEPGSVPSFKCSKCSYETCIKARLERHSLIHADLGSVPTFQCELCLFKTRTKHSLKGHVIRVHPNPDSKPKFSCSQCSYKTNFNRDLMEHVSRMHISSDAPFLKCEYCPYKNQVKKNLHSHIQEKHSHGHRKFQCGHCSHLSKRKEHLETHIFARHQSPGETKPFNCEKCSFQCSNKIGLDHHVLRIHSKPGTVPMYNCSHCKYTTKIKDDLKQHTYRLHTLPEDQVKYKCLKCSFTTIYNKYLLAHMRRRHHKSNDEYEPATAPNISFAQQVAI